MRRETGPDRRSGMIARPIDQLARVRTNRVRLTARAARGSLQSRSTRRRRADTAPRYLHGCAQDSGAPCRCAGRSARNSSRQRMSRPRAPARTRRKNCASVAASAWSGILLTSAISTTPSLRLDVPPAPSARRRKFEGDGRSTRRGASAWSRSSMRSSTCSMPMLSRSISGVTPAVACSCRRHLPMRRRRGMAGERLGVADIDEALDEPQRVVKRACPPRGRHSRRR